MKLINPASRPILDVFTSSSSPNSCFLDPSFCCNWLYKSFCHIHVMDDDKSRRLDLMVVDYFSNLNNSVIL